MHHLNCSTTIDAARAAKDARQADDDAPTVGAVQHALLDVSNRLHAIHEDCIALGNQLAAARCRTASLDAMSAIRAMGTINTKEG